jgi:hypothetical protein
VYAALAACIASELRSEFKVSLLEPLGVEAVDFK